MTMTMTMPHTYDAAQARRDYPMPWICRGEAVDLCIRFGFTEHTWRYKIKSQVPTHPNFNGTSWTRYNREALIKILEGC